MRRRHRRAGDRGFTLLEIMIVLALIGLIAASVGTHLYRRWLDGQIQTTKMRIRDLMGVVQESMLDDQTCPTIDQLVARNLLRNVPRDAWGTPLTLRCPSEHEHDPVDVMSAGPDKKAGTNDDINSWQL